MEISDLNNLSFGEPIWLLLLLLIPIVILQTSRKKNTQAIKFPSTNNFNIQAKPRLKSDLGTKFTFLFWHYFSNCITYARPRLDQSTQTIISSGVDIVLGVDLSASMLALDMSTSSEQPNTRLDVVKDVIGEFIEKRQFDRIGLVAFAVDPYLVSALTLDKEFRNTT